MSLGTASSVTNSFISLFIPFQDEILIIKKNCRFEPKIQFLLIVTIFSSIDLQKSKINFISKDEKKISREISFSTRNRYSHHKAETFFGVVFSNEILLVKRNKIKIHKC